MRRWSALLVLSLAFAGCIEAHPLAASFAEGEQQESEEQREGQTAPDASTSSCTAELAAQRFRAASQIDYDYESHTAAELFALSEHVLAGVVMSVASGTDGHGPSILVDYAVTETFKGGISPRNRVRFHLPTAPIVTEGQRDALLDLPEEVSIIAFLTTRSGDGWHHSSGSILHLRSPQGLLVAAPCGLSQAIVSEPLFAPDVASLADVEEALRSLASM